VSLHTLLPNCIHFEIFSCAQHCQIEHKYLTRRSFSSLSISVLRIYLNPTNKDNIIYPRAPCRRGANVSARRTIDAWGLAPPCTAAACACDCHWRPTEAAGAGPQLVHFVEVRRPWRRSYYSRVCRVPGVGGRRYGDEATSRARGTCCERKVCARDECIGSPHPALLSINSEDTRPTKYKSSKMGGVRAVENGVACLLWIGLLPSGLAHPNSPSSSTACLLTGLFHWRRQVITPRRRRRQTSMYRQEYLSSVQFDDRRHSAMYWRPAGP
jgi:hypothetical protein